MSPMLDPFSKETNVPDLRAKVRLLNRKVTTKLDGTHGDFGIIINAVLVGDKLTTREASMAIRAALAAVYGQDYPGTGLLGK